MLVKVEKFTLKGTAVWNEDALVENAECSLYGVIYGVSSLVPFRDAEGKTGGYLASNLLKDYINSLASVKGLKDEIVFCNKRLKEAMESSGVDPSKKEGLWGAALALVQIKENAIEYIQTGDCMILAIYEDGEIRILTRPQVAHLEEKAINKWRVGIESGLTRLKELRESVNDILKSNRYQSNVVGGYGVLNGEKEAVDFLEYGKVNRDRLKHILLLTDGLFLPEEIVSNEENYWGHVAKEILHKGLKQYTKNLQALEETDPECIEYIRFKKSDDKTGIVITFEETS